MKEVNEAITTVVSRRITKTKELLFEKLSNELTSKASEFNGYVGAIMLRPISNDDPEYRIVYKFKSQVYLDDWMKSDVRKEIIRKINPLLEEPAVVTKTSGILTWISLPGRTNPAQPKKYKITIVSWLALYPLISLIFFLFGGILSEIPLLLRTFLVTAIAMILMSYMLMPLFTKWFSFWLFPKDKEKTR